MRFFLTMVLLSLLSSLETRLSWASQPIPPPQPPQTATQEPKGVTGALERPPLLLGEGEQRLLHEEGLRKYALGGTPVHAHSIGESGILIKGVSPGLSDLWVWLKDGTTEHRSIRVEKTLGEDVKPALMRAIGQLQEAEVIISGNGVVVRGRIQTLAEVNRIAALTQGWPADVHDETEIAEPLLNAAQLKIETWIQKSKNPSKVRVEIFDGVLWVRGSIENPTERSVVETRVRSLFPLAKTEIDSLPDAAPTVHFRVFLLELKKSRFSTLGLGWPASQDGAFMVSSSAIQNLLQLSVTLNTLEGEGSVKILSSPELVVRAPGEAELFSGGEFPIQSQSAYYSSVTWKTFGLTLKLNVTHTSSEKVRLDVFTEVSHLDQSIAANSIPGLQTNRMKTQVDARYGVPLLLSGLLQNSVRETAKGLPFLRQIPVLGALFGSDDYLNERSELVAILVPSSTPPPAPISKLVRYSPKGSLPDPRTWISPDDEKRLRSSNDYPWNALQ